MKNEEVMEIDLLKLFRAASVESVEFQDVQGIPFEKAAALTLESTEEKPGGENAVPCRDFKGFWPSPPASSDENLKILGDSSL